MLAALIAIQAGMVARYVFVLRRWQRPLLADELCPKAAVVLCLRGGDPFLRECLQALLHLDYPRYEVHVVIDHPDDPSRPVVDDVLRQEQVPHVHVQTLTERRENCSLKCSSVVQAVSRLDDSFAIFAQTDADTIVHPTWLRELATALADDRVGAATGNRWYMPGDATWGTLVRMLWNSAAVISMYWYSIAWGGTLAVKLEALREGGLLERWRQAFCEDTMLLRQLRKLGLRVVFVPSLMMVNREGCDLGGYLRWGSRQLLTARLYHPAWPAVVSHGLLTFLMPAFALGLAVAAVGLGGWAAAAWAGAAFAAYQLACLLMLVAIEAGVRVVVRGRGEPVEWLTPGKAIKLPWALAVTQAVYPAVLLAAQFARNVQWRGVTYRIDGPWAIRLVEYRPYQEAPHATVSHASL
jgi:cellulose synthase/poly-beta-1,6-N-acetylglucosamine synthase-like glycosyltransferase